MKANLENFFEIFIKTTYVATNSRQARFSEYRLHKIFYTINNVGKIGRGYDYIFIKVKENSDMDSLFPKMLAEIETNVDIVFVIDVTKSMERMIDIIQTAAISFLDEFLRK